MYMRLVQAKYKSGSLPVIRQIYEEKIIPHDLQEEVFLGLDKGVDCLQCFLGQPFDGGVVPVIEAGAFQQPVETEDKLGPHHLRDMFLPPGDVAIRPFIRLGSSPRFFSH